MTIDQLIECTRPHNSCFIVQDHERGRTGSNYRCENGISMIGKHFLFGKTVKCLQEKALKHSTPSDDDESHRYKCSSGAENASRNAFSGGSTFLESCSLWVHSGHQNPDC